MHSDDEGLVLPPNAAPIQVIIIPCGIDFTESGEIKKLVLGECHLYENSLTETGIRVQGKLSIILT